MSLKGDKYETAEEVKFRLENTVVLYDKRPVYITRVSMPNGDEGEGKKEIARVFFVELPTGNKMAGETRKYLSSRNFDLTPFKMGYMNWNGKAIFVSRSPVRQNKQGLSAATAVFTDVKGQKSADINFAYAIRAQAFVDMIDGKYPSFREAGDRLGDKETHSVAISRSFAFLIDHDLEALLLLHKGVRCGIAMKNDKALNIPPKFHFLREEMEDHHIPIM